MARTPRAAFLVDGEHYFAALAEALARARHQILAVGWDFHSRVRLRRPEDGRGGEEHALAEVLTRAVRRRRSLRAHVLGWDFALFYALEREVLPLFQFQLRTPRRVQFRLDGAHPPGASQHQKLIVIDDALAFCGGFDVTACRWDTPEHRADDPRRSDPGFGSYGPFHDVQVAVDGEAAALLGAQLRDRWRRATGNALAVPAGGADPWPDSLHPDLNDVRVGIARTLPRHGDQPEVREVETLYADALQAARRSIYLENQYLTSARIGVLLEERLADPEGPEVVIVVPTRCSGWLEEHTMGELRARLMQRLRESDRFGRLRIYHPVVPGGSDLNVHTKALVVDDRLARVGSANLSNRSMGLDSECDLALEADTRDHAEAVARFRDGLLGEHLGCPPERVRQAMAETGSLVRAIESLRGGERTLVPAEATPTDGLGDVLAETALFDPESPAQLEELVGDVLPAESQGPSRSLALRIGVALAAAIALALAWRFTPLSEWLAPGQLAGLVEPLRGDPMGPVVVIGAYVAGGILMVPVTALIVATALVFGPAVGFATALAGSLLSGAVTYAIGRVLWRQTVRRIAGRRLNAVSRWLARRGVLSVAAVRIVPIAPFTVVNLVAGASHLRFRDYMVGTLLGMAPGTLALTALSDRLAQAVLDPGLWTFLVFAVLVGVVVLFMRWLRRRLAEETGHGLG